MKVIVPPLVIVADALTLGLLVNVPYKNDFSSIDENPFKPKYGMLKLPLELPIIFLPPSKDKLGLKLQPNAISLSCLLTAVSELLV